MARHIDRYQPVRDELPHDRAPCVAVVLLADAPGGELVMAEAPDALVLLAEQDRDDVRLAEALAGSIDAGEQLLRGYRAVERLGRREADVAIAAGPAVVAEIAQ